MLPLIIITLLPFCVISETMIDMNDILRPDLMPSSLMMIEGPKKKWPNATDLKIHHVISNGSWDTAYLTMGFHRKMLNEYLCRNFVADGIIAQIQKPFINKRLGKPERNEKNNSSTASRRQSRADFADVKENLLSDPGSSNYRDWLSKTTTLEDVYKHYEKDNPTMRIGKDSDDEYEGGEITGYAMPGLPDYPPPMSGYNHPLYMQQDEMMPQDSEKHGGGGFDYTPHHIHFHSGVGNSGGDKDSHQGLDLPDIFDMALTALAFLSFGIFILQVIMCISMNKTMPMMQMVDNGGETEGVDDIRFRRDLSIQRSSINELTRRVLKSIEAGLAANRDDGTCLRRILCENNKYSRNLEYNKRILVPVWGLGMSWLSSRLYQEKPSMTAILESLRACALGLANADCTALYKNCNMNTLLRKNAT